MKVCSVCGERNEDWMDICQRCGNSIVNSTNIEVEDETTYDYTSNNNQNYENNANSYNMNSDMNSIGSTMERK